MSDKIILKGMKLFGFHGVLKDEREFGRFFEVDIELRLSIAEAAAADDLTQAVDYSEVFEYTREIFRSKKYTLLETLANDLANRILSDFSADGVKVRVKKPDAPVSGSLEYAAVEVERNA